MNFKNILILLFALLTSAHLSASEQAYQQFLKNNHIDEKEFFFTSACTIYNMGGQIIRDYGGHHCLFESNGNYLIAETDGSLNYRDKNNLLIWSRPMTDAHHGLSKDSDGNFLVMSSDVGKFFKHKIRFDKFLKLSKKNGHVLVNFNLRDNYEGYSGGVQLRQQHLWPLLPVINNVRFEASHASSFNQISGLIVPSPHFSNGDYLLVILGRIRKIIILDGLTLKIKNIFNPQPYFIHDAKVLPDGKLVWLNNIPNSEKFSRAEVIKLRNEMSGNSTIEITDLSKQPSINSYFAQDHTSFYMPVGGSFQIFRDESIITLDYTNQESRIIMLTKNKNLIKKISMKQSGKIGLAYIRLEKLSDFLKVNIGL